MSCVIFGQTSIGCITVIDMSPPPFPSLYTIVPRPMFSHRLNPHVQYPKYVLKNSPPSVKHLKGWLISNLNFGLRPTNCHNIKEKVCFCTWLRVWQMLVRCRGRVGEGEGINRIQYQETTHRVGIKHLKDIAIIYRKEPAANQALHKHRGGAYRSSRPKIRAFVI